MYSQCPQCQAVFSVSESHLGAYHGLVRCGRCRAVFDAVANEVPGEQASFSEAPQPDQADVFGDDRSVGDGDAGRRAPTPASARDADHQAERIEPVLAPDNAVDVADSTDAGSAPAPPGVELPGEITEEILIEAPPVVSESFEDEQPPAAGDATSEPSADNNTRPPVLDSPAARAPLQSPYRARDIMMVELPQPRPFKTATLSLTVVLLTLLLVWQGKTFYLDALAQEPLLRPYLERICQPLACVLPPRRDFARIDVTGTSIDVNPEVPGALEIRVALINRAHFPQPYPPLRVTLSDSEGRIVGRRTYPPAEYLDEGKRELLPIQGARDAVINLAQPPQHAVGYEVELVAPRNGADS